uniref:Uncharacterized protein n=1 Tax=Mycena chlorophos TaxID=658473 RepID=A0ABQ0LC14_MYCCL|nr:predicted protein [Mycena chlorophos]
MPTETSPTSASWERRSSPISPQSKRACASGTASFGFGVVGYKADERHDHSQIVLLKVKALYEGGSGRHNDVSASTNVCRLSNIVAQTFESLSGANWFRHCKAATSLPETCRFELFTSRTFLCLFKLDATPVGTTTTSFRLSARDYERYQLLRKQISTSHQVLKLMGRRKSGGGV